ncbi:MAG: threonine/serine exporter family protein [Faecalibacterium sp.]|jgi:uncharacterized membrane protein YjjP (DUF1212 family)|nr:threonine/serine exporter family protein [Faecalibacterium sp.]
MPEQKTFGDAELCVAMDLGERLLVCGAEVSRVEDTITRICRAYGAARIDVFTITSSIVVTAFSAQGAPVTQTRRVGGPAFDLTALAELNALSRRLCAQHLDAAEVSAELARIDALPHYGFGQLLLIYALISGSFSLFFGGDAREALVAAAIGMLLKTMQSGLARLEVNPLISVLLCSVAGGFGAYGAVALGLAAGAGSISIGNVMLLIPGIALTNSIRDMFSGDTISGLLRFSEALISSAAIAWGFAIPAALFL